MSISDEKWKNNLIWKNGMKTLFPKQLTEYDRYYHRGSSPSEVEIGKNCCDTHLKFNRKYGNTVVSWNNPYADDNPGFAQYLTYNIFKNKVLTFHDIKTILNHYNNQEATSNGERLYGPFNQLNLNIISNTAYNEENWNQGWKGYSHYDNLELSTHPNIKKLPILYQVAYIAATEYKKAINRVIVSLKTNIFKFHIARNKIKEILRSSQTRYVKYILNVALTRNTKSKMYSFEVVVYYNPDENKMMLGKSSFIGAGTTDSILLPDGKNPSLFNETGRPLHPLRAMDSELMSENEANYLFLKRMHTPKNFDNFQYKHDIPCWDRSDKCYRNVSPNESLGGP